MDICTYVNSKSIGDYLRKIKYDFNAKEAAWLIYQCDSISVNEKHEAWELLMKEKSDFDLGERFDFLPDNSLYELIRRNIEYDNKQLNLFMKKENGTIYSYRFYCAGDASWCEEFDGLYYSLEECWSEIEKDMDLDIEVIDIRKTYISSNRTIQVRFKPDRAVLDVYSNFKDEADYGMLDQNFDDMWFDFPVPFEKGDILVPVYTPGPNLLWSEWGPFVMDSITPWEKELNERMHNATCGDASDMLAWGYFQDPDGRTFHEGTSNNYMNLEYYNGPFKGPRRLLIALSNYIKGKIRLELLLTAYRKIIMDEISEDVMLHSWYCEEELKLAGLRENPIGV